MRVYVIMCPSTCLQGEEATHGAEREKQRNACWELQLVFQSSCFLLSVIVLSLCIRAFVCVPCSTEVIEAEDKKAYSFLSPQC